ncbi:hypothetical protein [Thermoflexibacter ruber]|uniref:DKNYY family protein n=1 Tax=Thermoflexibacter ruber TaxID=1003 RepID=A0A1I2FXW4_9BACT|nr:hypothetical protein [Thermoflexibacter ruber]SFF09658.1 hypothetical protein SAMN04488541_1015112 [Thermoflexibacter ruber]
MNLIGYCLLFLATFLMASCDYLSNESNNQVLNLVRSKENLLFQEIKIDTILVNHPNSSYQGFFEYDAQGLYFFDKLFATASQFDKAGNYINSYLGKGQGPKEVPQIQNHLKIGQNHYIFSGYSIYVYDQNWERIATKVINWNPEKSVKELEENPKPEYRGIYEIKYFGNKYATIDNKYVVFNIESTHPKFNGFFSNVSQEYYKKAKIFAKMDLVKATVEELGGNYSALYTKNNAIPNFDFQHYDIANDSIFVGFEADSLIYVYDKKFKLCYAFGRNGRQIKQHYSKTQTYEQAMAIFAEERIKNGFYDDIKYFPDQSILFRCYTKGTDSITANNNPRRMQIYHHTTLIAEVDVPYQFRVIGFDGKYYYADGYADEEKEKLGFYRFTLK